MASRAPHNRTLNALRAEALAVAGRFAEARALCERALSQHGLAEAGAALWSYTLGRVLYESADLGAAAERLAESLQRPGAPAAAKPTLRQAKALLGARAEGNAAFKRGAWAAAVEAYT